MIRLASLFWLALVAATGFATFKVKYAVQDIEDELNKVWILRKVLAPLSPVDAMQLLHDKLLATKSNKDFLKSMELSSME